MTSRSPAATVGPSGPAAATVGPSGPAVGAGADPAVTRTLALAQLVNSIGDGGFYVTSALFFTRIVGLSTAQVGLVLTVGWGVGLLLSPPLGHVADRQGLRGTAVVLALTTALALAALLFVRALPAFLVAVCVYASSQSGLSGVRQALLARLVTPAHRVHVRARLQSLLNAGIGVGAALGGLALYLDRPLAYRAIFALDAMTFVAAAVVLSRLPSVPVAAGFTAGEPRLGVLRDRPYMLVTALSAVMLLYMPMLSVVLPLWVAQRTAAPRWMVAPLFLLNTLAVVLFQVHLARRVNDLESAARSVRHAGGVLLAACVVFAVSATTAPAASAALLVVGACLQAGGEMLLASGLWEISFSLACPDRPGQYQGVFAMGAPIARTIGPLALTTLIVTWSGTGWLVLGWLFLLAGHLVTPVVRWGQRDPGRAVVGDVSTVLSGTSR
jgi:MFS family permease